ncbi:BIG1-domain-containing protein [Aspergillus campestris IBT 28561]|uniref:Protein BIG1 n=1 Tax=Aspergillus campestris (strain IBT 28561) TaxID=1392248 RepID=A0A2I1CUH2_ASPC2|nr:BIG1-domain-containing protein [Aspergillus campestris IBT 28561]PKY01265.1 BIG1-domain-containing protein [Aspergillus campestris IBT 28561]
MHLRGLSLLALAAATANAFRDSSPFFLASTSEILTQPANLKSATDLLDDLSSALRGCPSDYYVLASQPGVHSTDFSKRNAAPRLGAKMTGKDRDIRSKMIVSEVVGALEAKQIQDVLEKECGAETTVVDGSSGSYPSDFGAEPRVILVDFPNLSLGSDRAQQLSDNDGLLSDVVERIPSSKKYTILYVTSPREFEEPTHDMSQSDHGSSQDPVHMDLKRDYSAHGRREQPASNSSLFQEYQYFTPGIFMGFMATFLFLAILYVGLSALLSLQVPYAAFEKDTSATVQKKQQ